MCSSSITSLTKHSAVENLESVKDFRLSKEIALFRAREYWWGLERGDIDIDSHLNRVSVRGDIERLLSEKALTLVPTKEVVDTMLELTIYNRKHTVYERQQCYSVLPPQNYQYRLVPGSQMKEQIPLFIFDSSSDSFQRFDYPYNDLPLFTLGCYPFFAVMHNSFALTYSRPIHGPFLDILKLISHWADPYPHVGSFVTCPRIAAMRAALAIANKDYDPYLDLEGTSGEDDDMVSGSEAKSELTVSASIKEPKNNGAVVE